MKVKSSVKECTDLITGVYGSTGFYVNFDRIVCEKDSKFSIESLKNKNSLNNLYTLLTKIQSHWNKNNRDDFNEFIKNESNLRLFKSFFDSRGTEYKYLIKRINLKGVQNTKISKLLYILNPDFIPMIDPLQGKFLIKKYNKTARNDLIDAIEAFHKYLKNNNGKIIKIQKELKTIKISITKLRVFELLIWLQTQLNKKDVQKEIIKNNIL